MKKLLVYTCVILMLISTAGCANDSSTGTGSTGSPETTESMPVVVQIDIAALKTAIVQQMKVEDSMDLTQESLSDMYGFAQEDIKASACCIAMGGAFVEEIILLECVDDAAVERIEKKLQTKLSDAMDMAQNYDAESYAILQNCKVQKNGTYVALFVSAKAEQMQKLFDDAAK